MTRRFWVSTTCVIQSFIITSMSKRKSTLLYVIKLHMELLCRMMKYIINYKHHILKILTYDYRSLLVLSTLIILIFDARKKIIYTLAAPIQLSCQMMILFPFFFQLTKFIQKIYFFVVMMIFHTEILRYIPAMSGIWTPKSILCTTFNISPFGNLMLTTICVLHDTRYIWNSSSETKASLMLTKSYERYRNECNSFLVFTFLLAFPVQRYKRLYAIQSGSSWWNCHCRRTHFGQPAKYYTPEDQFRKMEEASRSMKDFFVICNIFFSYSLMSYV